MDFEQRLRQLRDKIFSQREVANQLKQETEALRQTEGLKAVTEAQQEAERRRLEGYMHLDRLDALNTMRITQIHLEKLYGPPPTSSGDPLSYTPSILETKEHLRIFAQAGITSTKWVIDKPRHHLDEQLGPSSGYNSYATHTLSVVYRFSDKYLLVGNYSRLAEVWTKEEFEVAVQNKLPRD